jgi:putative membrane-bound dehydrogenase-like protein
MRKLWFAISLVFLCGCQKAGPPYSPAEALKTFRIEPGYRIEKFVAEPEVMSPVAMEFDENGRIFVAEDRGYPLNTQGRIGRIILLEDTNGDGIPDRRTVFADNLVMPTGVMRWKKGILVTDAPDVIYLEDTDGDGRADVRKVVLTGFPVTNPQHTVNNPVYGLDNWIYLAHENPATPVIFKEQFGDRGSDIRFPEKPDGPALKERGRNVRFRPDTFQAEALSGQSQFGHAFDDWGHHYTLNNSNHSRQEMIAARYVNRNPDLPIVTAMQEISDHGAAAKVFPIVPHPRFEMLTDVGQFTSACGLTFFHGSLFVAEPAHSLVHQDLLSDSGSTYLAKRAHEGVEFLASTDSWFRPVNFTIGPDGALYLMDFYRLVIEHPEWMATHTHHSKELTQGIDRGRIYRITADSATPATRPVRLGSASNADLVKELENPNIWWRRTAQRLLVDRQAADVAPELARMAAESQSPVGRLHALWTLSGLGKLETPVIRKALHDPEAGVRENAIVLAEPRLASSAELTKDLITMADDPQPHVRLQLLATLALVNTPASQAVRDRLLFRDIEDKWFQLAALSASSDDAPRLFQKVAAAAGTDSPGRTTLFRQVAAVIGSRGKSAEIERVLQNVATAKPEWWRTASLDGLAQGMRAKRDTLNASGAARLTLLRLFDDGQITVRRASLRLLEITGLPAGADSALERAAKTAQDGQADPDLRADAIGLLALSELGPRAEMLKTLVDPHQPEPVQAAAVRAVGKIKGDDTGKYLLAHWRTLTPAGRMEAADAMYLEPSRVKLLVAALQSGDVQPWTLAFRHTRRLIMYDDPVIRETARPLLQPDAGAREKVVKRYQTALDLKADSARGKEVFKSVCSKCHRLENVGAEVGPDLNTVRHQPKQILLTDILIPSQSISQGYEAYVVETVSGGTLDGVLGGQSSASVTLRHEDGKEDVIQRKDIKQMYAINLSAMPADLDKQVDVQQMADLLEYLKSH